MSSAPQGKRSIPIGKHKRESRKQTEGKGSLRVTRGMVCFPEHVHWEKNGLRVSAEKKGRVNTQWDGCKGERAAESPGGRGAV